MKRVRHFKNQKTYRRLGEALFQVSTTDVRRAPHLASSEHYDGETGNYVKQRIVRDGDPVEVYQSEEEGKFFVRFPDEMNDEARFISDGETNDSALWDMLENLLREEAISDWMNDCRPYVEGTHLARDERRGRIRALKTILQTQRTAIHAPTDMQPVASKTLVPISADGKYVFIDGRGDVPILYDCEGEMTDSEAVDLINQLFRENDVRDGSTFTHGAARAMLQGMAVRAYRAGRDDGFTKGWNAAPKTEDTIPKLENCGQYLARDNTGQWHYINHANTWQGCPDPLPDVRIDDNPDHDGTDGAHPAWWRGNDHGLHRVADLVTFWITEPDMGKVMAGAFGEPQLERLRASVIDLRHKVGGSDERAQAAFERGFEAGATRIMNARPDPLTKTDLRDALDCFWNAAIGEAHHKQDSTAFAVASIMASGIQAISNSLKEGK